MKTTRTLKTAITVSLAAGLATQAWAEPPKYKMTTDIPKSLTTPDKVETSIGTLEFLDGAPLPQTAEKVYDYLDTCRAMDAFLKGQPACSLKALIGVLNTLYELHLPLLSVESLHQSQAD